MFNSFWQNAWSVKVANHLWQSTLVVFVAWLLTLALRRYEARVRYWVWMAASLKFLLPFSLLASIGQWLQPAKVPLVDRSFARTVVETSQPFSGSQWLFFLMDSTPTIPSVSYQHHAFSPVQVLLAIWVCGSLVFLLRWLRDWLAIRSIVRAASAVPHPIAVPVAVTLQKIEPGVVGLLRPVVLFPTQLLEQLSAGQLRAIISHEKCHIQRRDNITAALHMLVEVVFWFHPAVWWIERRLIEERERACDEAVLQLGNDAETYAESILNVCKACAEPPLLSMTGVTGSELKQRILRIMTSGKARRLDAGCKLILSATAALLLSLPLVSGVLRSTEVHAQSRAAGPAQKIIATWQGTLHTNRDYRFVLAIATADDGNLKSTFYNLDGQPGGLPGFSTTFDGTALKLDLGFATYGGSLSTDGNMLTGRWHQGSESEPLIFVRATPATEWTIPQPPPPPTPMAENAKPEFEVSTVKPSRPEERGPRYMFDHRRFSVVHVTLSQLVQFAYNVQEKQIESEPDWFRTETYDIAGQPGGEGEPSIQQWRAMVKRLMADRFKLQLHTQKRELSVYALALAKSGPKFAKSHGDLNGKPGLGFGPGDMGATNATMAEIAEAMQQGAVDRPVVDQTGLQGRFDLRMRWTPSEVPADTLGPDAPPDIFTSMQEQLGLRLVATRAPVDVIVIDHVELPSAN